MNLFFRTTFLLAFLFISGALIASKAHAHDAQYPENKVIVSGNGEIEAEPDMAILSISIEAQKKELAKAKSEADDKYRKVLAVLKKAKIDKRFIKATQISAQPQYEWRSSQRIFKGYRVSRSLNITLNELEMLAPLMQDLVENGISSIDGISTDFSDRAELVKKAMGIAAQDAKGKASFLAEQLGRELGSATFISQNSHQSIQPRRQAYSMDVPEMAMKSAAPEPPQEQFGTQKIRARVSVHFSLL